MSQEQHLPRLLIVDDEPAIRRFLQTALAGGEFSLHQAENGQAALAAAVAIKPDLILLDLGLPDIDGVEVRTEALNMMTSIRQCLADYDLDRRAK